MRFNSTRSITGGPSASAITAARVPVHFLSLPSTPRYSGVIGYAAPGPGTPFTVFHRSYGKSSAGNGIVNEDAGSYLDEVPIIARLIGSFARAVPRAGEPASQVVPR